MANANDTSNGPMARTGRAWLRIYITDVVALPFGTALALKFWCGFFGVHDPLFMAIVAAASLCEVTKRIIDARREWQRPWAFCAERRFDLIAAIVLGTAPWPIALPLNGASPASSIWRLLAVPQWIGVTAAVIVLAITVRRLLSSGEQTHTDIRRRLVRDLSVVPELHVASMLLLTGGPNPSKA